MLVSNWSFPFLPPVELDTGCFKAIVSVIVDKLCMDRRVPHHLPTQTAGWLRKTAWILGKPLPGFPIPHLCLEHPRNTGVPMASRWLNTLRGPASSPHPVAAPPCNLPGTHTRASPSHRRCHWSRWQNTLTFFGTHPTLTWGEQEQVSVSRPSFPKAMLQRASHVRLVLHVSSLLRKTKAGLRVPGKTGV